MTTRKAGRLYKDAHGKPAILQSVAGYLDLLGFRNQMLEANTPKKQLDLLKRLRRGLSRAMTHFKPSKSISGPPMWTVKAFTDNIVVGWPVLDDAEFELGITFYRIAFFQMSLIREGFFVRGAVAVGPLYMDQNIVLGQALVEAYNAESELARDPRIVLAGSASQFIKHHITYYAQAKSSPQNAYLLKDADGQIFVNYLNVILDEAGMQHFLPVLEEHRTSVEKQLVKHLPRPAVWAKYLWCAHYHNYVCDQHPTHAHSYKIDLAKFQPAPVSIV